MVTKPSKKLAGLLAVSLPAAILVVTAASDAGAKVTGICSNCHTMHNSQDANPMTLDDTTTPNPMLTRGGCVGCHATGGGQRVYSPDTVSYFPQVYHNDGAGDLAAGNFGYIDGTKTGEGAASANKGHNVIDLFGANSDPNQAGLPGGIVQTGHDGYIVNDGNLTCAGQNGCHGQRYFDASMVSGLPALKGAHHANADGQCNPPADSTATVGGSYRFLYGIKGFENAAGNVLNRWQNIDANTHNEYYGAAQPMTLRCLGGGVSCHGSGGVRPESQTISGFCATCHGNFHTLKSPLSNGSEVGSGNSMGIGPGITSPFRRHPTDVVINRLGASSEYAAYTAYSVEAPPARTSLPGAMSAVVAPEQDAVTCLSCHMAHASPYEDMLRWDYSGMIAHSAGAAAGGCFTCHTTKDDQ
ncbi:MAG: cytochrome c3 family protein [Thermodesulfobacteriota bacterium]